MPIWRKEHELAPIDLTARGDDPGLTQEEVKAIRRTFHLDNIGDIL